jgi:hypothetical protein
VSESSKSVFGAAVTAALLASPFWCRRRAALSTYWWAAHLPVIHSSANGVVVVWAARPTRLDPAAGVLYALPFHAIGDGGSECLGEHRDDLSESETAAWASECAARLRARRLVPEGSVQP